MCTRVLDLYYKLNCSFCSLQLRLWVFYCVCSYEMSHPDVWTHSGDGSGGLLVVWQCDISRVSTDRHWHHFKQWRDQHGLCITSHCTRGNVDQLYVSLSDLHFTLQCLRANNNLLVLNMSVPPFSPHGFYFLMGSHHCHCYCDLILCQCKKILLFCRQVQKITDLTVHDKEFVMVLDSSSISHPNS